jgi:hypothetical protein
VPQQPGRFFAAAFYFLIFEGNALPGFLGQKMGQSDEISKIKVV